MSENKGARVDHEDDPGNDPNPLGGSVTTIIGDYSHTPVGGKFDPINLSTIFGIAHDDKSNTTYLLDANQTISTIDHENSSIKEFATNIYFDSMVLVPESHRTSEHYLLVYNNDTISIVSSSGICTPFYVPELTGESPRHIELLGGTFYYCGDLPLPSKYIIESQHGPHYYNIDDSSEAKTILKQEVKQENWLNSDHDGWKQIHLCSNSISSMKSIVLKCTTNTLLMIDPDTMKSDKLSDESFTNLRALILCSSQSNSGKIKDKIQSCLNKIDVLNKWPPGITGIISHLSSYISSYLLVVDGCSIRRVTLPVEFR